MMFGEDEQENGRGRSRGFEAQEGEMKNTLRRGQELGRKIGVKLKKECKVGREGRKEEMERRMGGKRQRK